MARDIVGTEPQIVTTCDLNLLMRRRRMLAALVQYDGDEEGSN